MKKIVWVLIAVVFLVAAAAILIPILRAPSKDIYQAGLSFIAASQEHVSGRQIDISTIKGDNVNAECVRIFAKYLNDLNTINSRLAQVKNDLVIMAQPVKLAVPAAVYEDLERQIQLDEELSSIEADLNKAVSEVSSKMEALDKSKLKVLDVVEFVDSLKKSEPERQRELGQYKTLSKYVKQLLEFTKSRNGYYEMTPEGYLRFKSPEDQDYYILLVKGINEYVKKIDDLRDQHNKEDRRIVNELSSAK